MGNALTVVQSSETLEWGLSQHISTESSGYYYTIQISEVRGVEWCRSCYIFLCLYSIVVTLDNHLTLNKSGHNLSIMQLDDRFLVPFHSEFSCASDGTTYM